MVENALVLRGFVCRRGIKDEHRTLTSTQDKLIFSARTSQQHFSYTMQFSRNFSGLAVFILALASVGMTTPLAAVSNLAYGPILAVHFSQYTHYLI